LEKIDQLKQARSLFGSGSDSGKLEDLFHRCIAQGRLVAA